METLILRLIRVITGILLGLAVAFWIFYPRSGETAGGGEREYFLGPPLEAPDFRLTSHLGESVSSQDFPGKVLAVFFGYTFCPDVCPMTLSKLTEAFGLLGERGGEVQVLLISVDPGRDTPDQMKRYLANFHPSFMGLTGSMEELRRISDGFGAYFEANGSGEDYTVDHSARLFIVTPEGNIPLTFPMAASPAEIVRDLSILLDDVQGGAS